MHEQQMLQALREIGSHLVVKRKTRKRPNQSYTGVAISYLQRELRLDLEIGELTALRFNQALNHRLLVLGRLRKGHKTLEGIAYVMKAYGVDGAEQLLNPAIAGKKTVH